MGSAKPTAGKLNPFALPPETDARFILLMMSALALASVLSELLIYAINPDAANPIDSVPLAPAGGEDLPLDEYFRAQVEFATQAMLASLSGLMVPLILSGITFFLAAILYWDHPRQIRRRKAAVLFAPQSDPRFAQELTALSGQAGLPAPPVIELGKRLSAQDGQAFGVGRRKSIYLDGGLRILLRKSVENFRAILRHELAHIVNRDVGRTYFAQSLWIAVILVTILPLFVSTTYILGSSIYLKAADGITIDELQRILFLNLPTYFGVVLRLAGLILLILLVRAGLLRTREVYADWRAALWGSSSALTSIFEAQSRRKKTGPPLLHLHPSPIERLNTLKAPRRLFDVHFDIPFIAGVFTALILNGLFPVIVLSMLSIVPGLFGLNATLIRYSLLLSSDTLLYLLPLFYGLDALLMAFTLLIGLLPFLILAPLAAATVGLQVQRQALADLAEGRSGLGHYLMLALPAAWMGLGIIVGVILSPLSSATLAPRSLSESILALAFLIVFVFFIWLALIYARFFSQRLLGSHAKLTPPAGKNRFLTLLVAVIFLAIEAPLVAGFFIITKALTLATFQAFLTLIGIALVMLLLMGLTFVSHWIVFWLYRRIRPVRCPSCGAISRDVDVLQKDCWRCGKSMVPWLYVTV